MLKLDFLRQKTTKSCFSLSCAFHYPYDIPHQISYPNPGFHIAEFNSDGDLNSELFRPAHNYHNYYKALHSDGRTG
jgi:hypothetical protein